MKKTLAILYAALLIPGCGTLAGCAGYKSAPQTIFDLGPLPPAQHMDGLRTIAIAEPDVPAWLDNPDMYYRLSYANNQQLRPYVNSRWSMPPMQLFEQRLKARIAQAGGEVLSTADSANNVPWTLHVEADDFTQSFDSAEHSKGQVTLRVSLFNGRGLLAQQSFSAQAESPSADAAGGARALAGAGDAVISDILKWLSGLAEKK